MSRGPGQSFSLDALKDAFLRNVPTDGAASPQDWRVAEASEPGFGRAAPDADRMTITTHKPASERAQGRR